MKRLLHHASITAQILIGLILSFNSQLSTAQAQNTVFTYQGQVQDNGALFTGIGQFQFALVTSTNANHAATATANAPSGGYVTGYNVTFGGNGYVTAPAVTIFGGGGSNAAAIAHLTGGSVTSISVANPGDGNYSSTPVVLIAPPPPNISYTTYWSNDGTSAAGSEPSLAVSVPVTNGLFTVALGDQTQPGMNVIPADLFSSQPNLQLRIWFNDGTHGFAALNPAQNVTPAPYAVAASSVIGGLTIQQNIEGAPNVIAGYPANLVTNGIYGATIAGGGQANFSNSVTADFGTVGGGGGNTASGWASTVGGGANNTASSPDGSATVGGGDGNIASGDSSTIGGGENNTADALDATVGGGFGNYANYDATVAGGYNNSASTYASSVGGGYFNSATGNGSTVSGGGDNIASGEDSIVAGGVYNTASGNFSFAGGYEAEAKNNNSFVWSDGSSGELFSSTANSQFAVEASGGLLFAGDVQLSGGAAYHHLSLSGGNSTGYLYASYPALGDGIFLGYNYYNDAAGNGYLINTGGGTSRISIGYGSFGVYVGDVDKAPSTTRIYADTTGVSVYGTFNNNSDRNAKQDFAPVIAARILEKVDQLPITEWSYKEDPKTRHVGPVAQDFHSIFNIGTDEKHIAPIDEGGIALAAIQGLNQKLKEKDTEIQELKTRLDKLERLIDQQNVGER